MPYLNWGLAVTCFLVQLTIQVSSGLLASQLSAEFGLDSFGVAILMGMVFYPNICLQIPAGIVTDRFGARKVLSVGALVCSLGAWGFASSTSFLEACLFRVIMGSGLAFAFVSMAYLIANWMRREVFSRMFCIAEMIALSFTVVAMRYLAVTLQATSWRDFIHKISIIALVLSILSALLIRDRPNYLEDSQNHLTISDIITQLKLFIKDRQMWANGIYSGLLFSCLSCFVAQWGPNFLANATTMGAEDAANMCTNLTLGLVVGCPLLSWVLPKITNIRLVLSLSALLTSILISCVVMFPMMDVALMQICLLLAGFFSVAYLVPFTIAHYYVRPGSKSTAIGFTNMLSTIFGPVLSILIGLLIDLHRDADLLSGYTLADYQYAMNILPMSMFLASLVCFFLPATHKPGMTDDI
ncbi:MAG: MFS transporter [Pseudomonadota bacterium]|nr:MFS transporter [Pseudomonadota bacterium]